MIMKPYNEFIDDKYNEFIDDVCNGVITDKDIPKMNSEMLKVYELLRKAFY